MSFNAMIGAAASSTWQRVVRYFSALRESGLRADRITYSAFQVLPWADALELASSMMKQSLRGELYVSMIKAAGVSTEAALTHVDSVTSNLWQLSLSFIECIQDQDEAVFIAISNFNDL